MNELSKTLVENDRTVMFNKQDAVIEETITAMTATAHSLYGLMVDADAAAAQVLHIAINQIVGQINVMKELGEQTAKLGVTCYNVNRLGYSHLPLLEQAELRLEALKSGHHGSLSDYYADKMHSEQVQDQLNDV